MLLNFCLFFFVNLSFILVGSILATEPRKEEGKLFFPLHPQIYIYIYSHTYQCIQIYDIDICIDLYAYICMLYKYIYQNILKIQICVLTNICCSVAKLCLTL